MGVLSTFEARDVSLLYALDERPGSDSLIVGFPKLRKGVHKPPTGLRKYIGHIEAHQLYVGSDDDQFLGPRRGLRGSHAAAELARRTAERLEVPDDRIVFFGTSYAAVVSCIVGLLAGGVVLAGAPAVALGTVALRWAELGARGTKGGGAEALVYGEGDPELTPAEWLDALIPGLARAATRPVRMRLLTGPADYGYASTRAFVEAMADSPVVTAEIIERPDEPHGLIARAFWSLLPGLVADSLKPAA